MNEYLSYRLQQIVEASSLEELTKLRDVFIKNKDKCSSNEALADKKLRDSEKVVDTYESLGIPMEMVISVSILFSLFMGMLNLLNRDKVCIGTLYLSGVILLILIGYLFFTFRAIYFSKKYIETLDDTKNELLLLIILNTFIMNKNNDTISGE